MHTERDKVGAATSSVRRVEAAMPPLPTRHRLPVTGTLQHIGGSSGNSVARLPHALHTRRVAQVRTLPSSPAASVQHIGSSNNSSSTAQSNTPCMIASVLTFGATRVHSHCSDDGDDNVAPAPQPQHTRTARSASIVNGSSRSIVCSSSGGSGGGSADDRRNSNSNGTAAVQHTTYASLPLQKQLQQQQQRCGAELHIEGVRTGEAVVVGDASHARRASASSDADALQLRRRLARLQSVCSTQQDKLQQAARQLRSAYDEAALARDEADARLALALHAAQSREASMTTLLTALSRLHTALTRAHAGCDAQLRAQREDSVARAMADAATLSTLQSQLAELTATLQSRDAADSARNGNAQSRLDECTRALDELRTRSAHEQQQLEQEKMVLQEQLQQQSRELAARERQAAHDAYLVAQCRLFVKDVCQPTFHVVKDATLAPVDRARSGPTGYVLVPLITLLHGYTLLPEDERRDVIAQYEAQAARIGAT